MLKSLMISSVCLTFGTAFAAETAGNVIEINENVAPEVIENGLFPKSSSASDCAEAAKAGFTCGQIVPRKVFSLPAGISFASGSARLSEPAKKLLASFGPILKRNEASGNTVVFVGHTDITGSKPLTGACPNKGLNPSVNTSSTISTFPRPSWALSASDRSNSKTAATRRARLTGVSKSARNRAVSSTETVVERLV